MLHIKICQNEKVSQLLQFEEEPGAGALLLLYSLVLSRGVQKYAHFISYLIKRD